MQYTEQQIQNLMSDFMQIKEACQNRCYKLSAIEFTDERANEFLKHGFLRRLSMIFHCITRVFQIYPPKRTKILDRYERLDIEAFIQTFMINLYGAIDNLAWIVNAEKQLNLSKNKISLYNKQIQQYFTQEFKTYLNDTQNGYFKKWYEEYFKNFRHSLGHRIPLYVPPFGVEEVEKYNEINIEKSKALSTLNLNKYDKLEETEEGLKHILPFYMHSFEEQSKTIILHPQLIVDFKTLMELTDNFFKGFVN